MTALTLLIVGLLGWCAAFIAWYWARLHRVEAPKPPERRS